MTHPAAKVLREQFDEQERALEEAKIAKGLKTDDSFFKPVWSDFRPGSAVPLWTAACLSLSVNPRHRQAHQGWLKRNQTALTGKVGQTATELLERYATALRHSSSPRGGLEVFGQNLEIELQDFGAWAITKDFTLPVEFPRSVLVSKVVTGATNDKENSTSVMTEKPWLTVDPKDPKAEQPWYTPARYFARQLVFKDSTLLIKRLALAGKVSESLATAGIYKRGGKKALAADTVMKAFVNVDFGQKLSNFRQEF